MSTGIISLNSFNKLISLMVKSCAFYEVRTEFLIIILINVVFKWLIYMLWVFLIYSVCPLLVSFAEKLQQILYNAAYPCLYTTVSTSQ